MIIGIICLLALVIGLWIGLWPCEEGFSGRGVGNCEDIDECEDSALHDCHEDAHCKNTVGSWNCTCKVGHDGNGQYCHDVDECKSGKSS